MMSKSDHSLAVESMETEKLVPYANNAKQHPPAQVDQIVASIKEFGFNDPIAIDENDTIIEGHGRLLAARKLGLKEVPIIRLSHLNEPDKKAYILAHNKLCLNSGFDLDMLRLEISELQELSFGNLSLTGFRPEEIDALFKSASIPDTEPELFATDEMEPKGKQVTCPACNESFYA
jgi:ParB-like nuclease family protein